MRLSTILAGTVIAGTAMLGLAAPAFAGTVTTPAPTSAVTTPTTSAPTTPAATPTVTVTPSWTPTGHPTPTPTWTDHKGDCQRGDNQWNKNCDPHGDNNCRQGDQWNRDTNKCDHGDNNNCRQWGNQWNTQDNQWNRDHGKCDPQVDVCHFTRTQLPWGCINKCHFFPLVTTTAWNDQGPWVFENSNKCDNGDHHNRHPRNHCTNQLLVFNFPHNSSVLTETFGPRLQVNEVAIYQGQTYVISGVWHIWSHDRFTVSQNGHLVTNHGPSIWHGNAWVRVCTCTTR